MRRLTLAALLLAASQHVAAAQTSRPADWRWIEAESAFATNLSVRHGFAPATDAERAALSGGAWIGGGDKKAKPFAVYDVDVPRGATYTLYARKFWRHGPFRVSFDDGQTFDVTADAALLDSTPIRTNVVANWVNAGTFKLTAGRHRFRVEAAAAGGGGAFAIDCFLLTPEPFVPRGPTKPDVRLASRTPGWFAWDPPPDATDSPIDVSFLNEPFAGSKGYIEPRGAGFVHHDTGEPAKFWGVNIGDEVAALSDVELDQLASLLARRGVNLVRIHGPVYQTSGKTVGAVDPAKIRNVRRAVRAMKAHGIYSAISLYFPLWVKLDATSPWPGYKDQNPFALLFIDPKFQQMHQSWWRALLAEPDPETGQKLADDPAVFSCEVVNEDSLFFWTFKPYENVPADVMENLERRFAAWLAKRYGSAQAAVDAWRADAFKGDDPANGRVGICPPYRMFEPRDARARDTVAFLFEVQSNYYRAAKRFFREDLKTRAMVVTSNWETASDRYLLPLERAAALEGDYVDRHGYYHGVNEGPKAGYLISDGDRYSDRSALRFEPEKPGDAHRSPGNPLLDTTWGDAPTALSEVDWQEPNRFRAEMPWMAAAYGGLDGLDAIAFFAVRGGPYWQSTVAKYSTLSPVTLGQYPAAALMFRTGAVEESIASEVGAPLDALLKLDGLELPPSIARYAGGVRASFAATRPSVIATPGVDAPIASATRQVALDPTIGLLTIDAPRGQAVCGFLAKAGKRTFGDVTIESSMEYGSIAVVPLDGEPIARSRRLLVQAMSEQTNSGWRTSGATIKTIDSIGSAPMLVRDLAGTIEFRETTTWTATPYAPDGRASGPATPIADKLTLASDAAYWLLTR